MIYQKIQKIVVLLIAISLIIYCLSSKFNIYDIDNLAYVIAIGFDVGEKNMLKISFQLSALGSASGDSGKAESDNPKINTIECSSFNSGLNLINSYLSKEVNLSHCKVVVFSEELAQNSISDYIYTLANNPQIRPETNVIISKCNAEYYLQNSKPVLESLSARYYETVPLNTEYTGFTQNVTLKQFFTNLSSTSQNPVAILGAVNSEHTQDLSSDLSNFKLDSNHKAGESNIGGGKKVDTTGLAVFKENKLVGELTAEETLCHIMVIDRMNRAQLTLPSPFVQGETISLSIQKHKSINPQVYISNNTPYITLTPSYDAYLLTSSKHGTALKESEIDLLEEYTNSYLNSIITNYLYKTSKLYKSDIDGFGLYAKKYFTYTKDWNNFNWNSVYETAFFNVDSKVNIISSQLLMQT